MTPLPRRRILLLGSSFRNRQVLGASRIDVNGQRLRRDGGTG